MRTQGERLLFDNLVAMHTEAEGTLRSEAALMSFVDGTWARRSEVLWPAGTRCTRRLDRSLLTGMSWHGCFLSARAELDALVSSFRGLRCGMNLQRPP